MPDDLSPDVNNKPIDLDDAATNDIVQVDTVAMATAKAFGDIPVRAAFSKVAAIEAEANLIQNQPGSELFSRHNGGPIKNLRDDEKSEEEKRIDQLRDAVAFADELRERQRDEWEKQVHSFAGANLTGEQWGELGTELQEGGVLKEWLIARLMKGGNTRDDAEKKAKEITDIARILAKPEREWTQGERAQVENGKRNEEFQEVMPELAEQSMKGTHSLAVSQAAHSSTQKSVEAREDAFASAPDLSQHHAAALSAQTPLDAVKPLAAAPQAPEPSMGGLG